MSGDYGLDQFQPDCCDEVEQLTAENAELRTLLREAHDRLGTITELAFKSGADDLRSRIAAALENYHDRG
jgi:hypothetical protein